LSPVSAALVLDVAIGSPVLTAPRVRQGFVKRFVKIIPHVAVRFKPAGVVSTAQFDAVQRNGIATFVRRKLQHTVLCCRFSAILTSDLASVQHLEPFENEICLRRS
jgi:hypothetical protein